MCGIVFVYDNVIDSKDVYFMLDKIIHRGRDNSNVTLHTLSNGQCALGHNRLSINDLSSAGNQPFSWNNLHLVVNGEIWNYPKLREEYEERGYVFFSNSDSEIILYLYKENELNRLDGMFSFIILDGDDLIVSRDWVGKIPLYISTGNRIEIASEVKALNQKTNVRIIPKNSLIKINLVKNEFFIQENYYFTFSPVVTKCNSNEEVGQKTFELLENAVDKRLLSDVPIATCLSGGIDSSVITYLLKQKIPNLKAYTVKFDENSPDLRAARIVADALDVELIEVEIPTDEESVKQRFLESIKVIEFPSTVQMEVCILQSYLAEAMAKDGIKVAFSGEGSDEAYGSYGMFRMFSKKPDWSDVRKKLFEKQHYGNLLRGNNVFMYYGTIEIRVPFFDIDFLNYTTNLPSAYTSDKKSWKLPLVTAFKNKLPDEILYQEKRAFQKGTNAKTYLEEMLLNDEHININNRKKMIHMIQDNFKKNYGFKHSDMRKDIILHSNGILQWMI